MKTIHQLELDSRSPDHSIRATPPSLTSLLRRLWRSFWWNPILRSESDLVLAVCNRITSVQHACKIVAVKWIVFDYVWRLHCREITPDVYLKEKTFDHELNKLFDKV
jgi:hypothetical protein